MTRAHAPNEPYPMTQRILDLIEDSHGGIRVDDLPRMLDGFDRGGIDVAISALLRKSAITRALGYYQVVKDIKFHEDAPTRKPVVALAVVESTSTKACVIRAGDAASVSGSLLCIDCKEPVTADQLTPTRWGPIQRCRSCTGKRVRRGVREKANPSAPERSLQDEARHSPAGVIDRDEAQRVGNGHPVATRTNTSTVADDSAERRDGSGDVIAEPTARSLEPEQGNRQSQAVTLGKVPPAQLEAARANAIRRRRQLLADLGEIDAFLTLAGGVEC